MWCNRRNLLMLTTALLALAPASRPAYAHGGSLASDGAAQVSILLDLAGLLVTMLYLVGTLRLWSRAGIDRGVRLWQASAFVAAVNAVFLALYSPLDGLSEVLFSAHMVQHMLLIFVAAPLAAICDVPVALLWSMPRRQARALGRWWVHRKTVRAIFQWLTDPLIASALFGISLWVWHVPALFNAALAADTLHTLEHASFFVSSTLFWWAMIHLIRHGQTTTSLIYLGAALLQSGALGALLTLSSQPWYFPYAQTTLTWGLSPLDDQQLGGVLMWVPGHLMFMAAILVVAYRWLAEPVPTGPVRKTF